VPIVLARFAFATGGGEHVSVLVERRRPTRTEFAFFNPSFASLIAPERSQSATVCEAHIRFSCCVMDDMAEK
jgi:hypothetical protein